MLARVILLAALGSGNSFSASQARVRQEWPWALPRGQQGSVPDYPPEVDSDVPFRGEARPVDFALRAEVPRPDDLEEAARLLKEDAAPVRKGVPQLVASDQASLEAAQAPNTGWRLGTFMDQHFKDGAKSTETAGGQSSLGAGELPQQEQPEPDASPLGATSHGRASFAESTADATSHATPGATALTAFALRDLEAAQRNEAEVARRLVAEVQDLQVQRASLVEQLESARAEARKLNASMEAVLHRSETLLAERGLTDDIKLLLSFKQMPGTGYIPTLDLLKEMTKDLSAAFPKSGGFVELIPESSPLTRNETIRNTFMISSVSNPCDWYARLWNATSASDADDLNHKFGCPDEPDPFFSQDRRNYSKFANWLTWVQGRWNSAGQSSTWNSVMSLRYWEAMKSSVPAEEATDPNIAAENFGTTTLDRYSKSMNAGELGMRVESDLEALSPSSLVDCWVSTENYLEDLQTCLQKYEKLSGVKFNWEPFAEAAVQDRASGVFGLKECSDHYTPELASTVLTADRHIFKAYGYDQCCGFRGR